MFTENSESEVSIYEPDLFVKEGSENSVPNLHYLTAATGNDRSLQHMEHLMADGAIYIAFILRPDDHAQAICQFIFHKNLLIEKGSRRCAASFSLYQTFLLVIYHYCTTHLGFRQYFPMFFKMLERKEGTTIPQGAPSP